MVAVAPFLMGVEVGFHYPNPGLSSSFKTPQPILGHWLLTTLHAPRGKLQEKHVPIITSNKHNIDYVPPQIFAGPGLLG